MAPTDPSDTRVVDVKEFPKSAADVVENFAGAVGRASVVNPLLKLVEAMSGNPDAVMAACDKWGANAVKLVSHCADDLEKLTTQVTETWTGDAAERFADFMIGGAGTHSVAQAIDDTVMMLSKVSLGLFDLYDVVRTAHEQATDHLGECAKTLLSFHSDLSAAIGEYVDINDTKSLTELIGTSAQLEKAINDALSKFITIAGKIYSYAIDDLLRNQKRLTTMLNGVARLPRPDGVVDTVEDPSLFRPA